MSSLESQISQIERETILEEMVTHLGFVTEKVFLEEDTVFGDYVINLRPGSEEPIFLAVTGLQGNAAYEDARGLINGILHGFNYIPTIGDRKQIIMVGDYRNLNFRDVGIIADAAKTLTHPKHLTTIAIRDKGNVILKSICNVINRFSGSIGKITLVEDDTLATITLRDILAA